MHRGKANWVVHGKTGLASHNAHDADAPRGKASLDYKLFFELHHFANKLIKSARPEVLYLPATLSNYHKVSTVFDVSVKLCFMVTSTGTLNWNIERSMTEAGETGVFGGRLRSRVWRLRWASESQHWEDHNTHWHPRYLFLSTSTTPLVSSYPPKRI